MHVAIASGSWYWESDTLNYSRYTGQDLQSISQDWSVESHSSCIAKFRSVGDAYFNDAVLLRYLRKNLGRHPRETKSMCSTIRRRERRENKFLVSRIYIPVRSSSLWYLLADNVYESRRYKVDASRPISSVTSGMQ